jgi:carbon-monoxide dehydrogenase medium subunit
LPPSPALADATRIIGGWQIQSRASVGGNLCNSSPAGDTIPALIALGAPAVIAGPNGERAVKAEEFCTGPGKNGLQPGELVVSIVFPAPVARGGSAYQRFIPRNEMDIAVAGAGSWVQLSGDGKTVEKCRIGLGAVAATPQFMAAAGEWLTGVATESFAQLRTGEKVASPITDMRGRRARAFGGCAVKRTLVSAVERARG